MTQSLLNNDDFLYSNASIFCFRLFKNESKRISIRHTITDKITGNDLSFYVTSGYDLNNFVLDSNTDIFLSLHVFIDKERKILTTNLTNIIKNNHIYKSKLNFFDFNYTIHNINNEIERDNVNIQDLNDIVFDTSVANIVFDISLSNDAKRHDYIDFMFMKIYSCGNKKFKIDKY